MISTLTGYADSVIKTPYSNKEPYAPYVDIWCDQVFTLTYGQIVFVGWVAGYNTVTIKVNHNEILRYGHLANYQFPAGYKMPPKAKIGDAAKFVRFEYCTTWQGDSKFPVYIGKYTYYKQNPTDILEGRYMPKPEYGIQMNSAMGVVEADYRSDTQSNEFGGS